MVNNWQPIETALKDGTEILAFDSKNNLLHIASWDKEECWWFVARQGDGYEEQIITIKPTHWISLPELPEKTKLKNNLK